MGRYYQMNEQTDSLISFRIGEEFFAFDTHKVRHILEMTEITKVPNAKSFFLGVVNLHGNIVPVADFRLLLGTSDIQNTNDTSIIVTSIDGNNDSYIGYVVDHVDEVFELRDIDVKENIAIDSQNEIASTFIGNVFVKNSFVHIIDLEQLSQIVEQ